MTPTRHERIVERLRRSGTSVLILLATLLALEGLLRVVNLKILRDSTTEQSLSYQYDPELGWAPVPHSSALITNARTFHAHNNSLGLRDIEFVRDSRPTMLFIGDSFVWGLDAEADERFTDLLRRRIPDYNIVNAGVSGYGNDQEYLLLQRLWPKIEPKVVVLVFCAINDRLDNTSSVRYQNYQKPYFATLPDGTLQLGGQPVPKSRQVYIKENWLVRHSLVARVAVYNYLDLVHPAIKVPDPTEKLVGKIRDLVEAHAAKLVVGMQATDKKLALYLTSEHIPQVSFDGAEAYTGRAGGHWTPNGQKLVADRLFTLLSINGFVGSAKASQ